MIFKLKILEFPQSMIKFKYFCNGNHCQIEFFSRGKIFFPTLKNVTFFLLSKILREIPVSPDGWILACPKKINLTMISIPKILEFYHTLRKTWKLDVQGGIGPIKIRPYFDMPNPTLNIKIPSFPQSMIKFKYFWLENRSQIKNRSIGTLFFAIF